MTLPILDEQSANELFQDSEGRAVSYTDAPEWFCGVRKCTHMSRDGMGAVGYMEPGSRESLAYPSRSMTPRTAAKLSRKSLLSTSGVSRVDCSWIPYEHHGVAVVVLHGFGGRGAVRLMPAGAVKHRIDWARDSPVRWRLYG